MARPQIHPYKYILYLRIISRCWLGNLSGSEFAVILFVFARTIDWSKYEETIPLRHFVEGIWDQDYDCVQPPVRMDKKTLIKALKHLTTMTDNYGNSPLKVRTRHPRASRYSLDFRYLKDQQLRSVGVIPGDVIPTLPDKWPE